MATLEMLDSQRELVRKALEHRAEGALDARSVARATHSLWRDVSARLAPIIGTGGVDALLDRSLQLSTLAFPWLVMDGEPEAPTHFVANLEQHLQAQDSATAMEASVFIIVTYSGLLAALIGEPLTMRLLNPIWTLKGSGTSQEASL